jgi:hypothetical protein
MTLKRPATGIAEAPHLDGPGPAVLMYVKSYLLMRIAVGLLGISLPVLLVLGDGLLFHQSVPRPSLSAYYHSDVGDVFVGVLCAVGFFLITYMLFHYTWDNVLSTLAGAMAIGVALFPTGRDWVGSVHVGCAIVFILSLAAISWLFGAGEHSRDDRGYLDRRRGRLLHRLCTVAILGAVSYVLVNTALENTVLLDSGGGRADPNAMFWGETVAVVAFGISWFVKGADMRTLRSRPAPAAACEPSLDA